MKQLAMSRAEIIISYYLFILLFSFFPQQHAIQITVNIITRKLGILRCERKVPLKNPSGLKNQEHSLKREDMMNPSHTLITTQIPTLLQSTT